MASVAISGGCWWWTKALLSTGYGLASSNGKKVSAHRLSYETFKGPIPEGLVVRHTCDNRACCNPEHLVTGTHKNNMQDAVERRRIASGESQGLSKLNWEAVQVIRGTDRTSKDLAETYGVSTVTINRVRRNITWQDAMEDQETPV